MHSFPARIHPALTSFADECFGTLARLMAYVGTLALLGIGGVHLWDQLPDFADAEPPAKASWSVAARTQPAFAVGQIDSSDKTVGYEIFRHPEGGRKDVFRWTSKATGPDDTPIAELEIYRPGAELTASQSVTAEISARMDPNARRELEAAGVIDSKFGKIALLRRAGSGDGAGSCLGFLKRFDEPNLQISGWTCQGVGLPARRAAIACVLGRLVLLTAGNDAKLADLFARAELRRTNCSPIASPAISADWVVGVENPLLRGRL